MRILRLKLKNFIGIYRGMGRKEIEIDFTKTENRFILLLGINGSGKTTIQSSLHPFASTFDIRSNIILEGQAGLKEIDIQFNEYTYLIEHHYGKTVKSFIEKIYPDGTREKLNKSGTVRSFADVIYNEFGITEDYFQLSKIGSQAKNFINLKSSQRKEFIGIYTPDVEEYNTAYANVNSRLNATNKEIKFINDEFDKLDSQPTVEKNIQIYKATIKKIKDNIASLNTSIGRIKEKISNISIDEIEDIRKEIDANNKERKKIIKHLESINNIYNGKLFLINSNNVIEKLNEMVSIRETNLEKYSKEYEDAKIESTKSSQDLVRTKNEITEIEKELKVLQTSAKEDEVKELENNLENIQKRRSEFIELKCFDNNDITEIDNFSHDDIEELRTNISFYEESLTISNSIADYTLENIPDNFLAMIDTPKTLNELETEIIKYFDNYISKLKFEETTKLLEKSEKEYFNLKVEIAACNSSKDLKQFCASGSNCCLYQKIENSENGKSKKFLVELERDIKTYKDIIEKYNNTQEEKEKILKIISHLKNSSSKIKDEIKEFLMPILSDYDSKFEDIDFGLATVYINNSVMNHLENEITKTIKYCQDILKVVNYNNKINEINNEINKFSDTIPKIKFNKERLNKLKSQYKSLEEKASNDKIILNEKFTKVNKIKEVIVNIRESLKLFNDIYEVDNRISSKENEIKASSDKIEELESLQKELISSENELESSNESLAKYEEEITNENLKLARIKEYLKRKQELEENRAKYAIIKDAVDIRTGAPLYLVGNYLESIKLGANRLLNMAYNGKFYIDFNITDREFSIPVFNNGSKTADDILECSQGEVSLVKTSLSLGIITQTIRNSIKQYNIINLDEIDAELDYKNQRIFVSILNKQLDALNSEQCFIITHNTSFNACNAGLILLKEANVDINDEAFMEGKDIIFQV